MLQNCATIPLHITHKNVTFCHEETGVQKGFLIAACLLACSLFKHPLLSIVLIMLWHRIKLLASCGCAYLSLSGGADCGTVKIIQCDSA